MKTIRLNKEDVRNISNALKHYLMSTPLANNVNDLFDNKQSYSHTLQKIEEMLYAK